MEQSEPFYVGQVMAYFSCNKDLAEKIIRASKANGEFENIKHLCEVERRTQNGNDK